MALSDDVNRILRDHIGYAGDGQGGVGPLPVGDRSTPRHMIANRDLRELFGALLAAIYAELDANSVIVAPIINALNSFGVRVYGTRADAEANAQSLPSGVMHILTVESYGLAVRGRTAFTVDPLFPSGARWGVARRLTTVDALENVADQLAAEAEARALGDEAAFEAAARQGWATLFGNGDADPAKRVAAALLGEDGSRLAAWDNAGNPVQSFGTMFGRGDDEPENLPLLALFDEGGRLVNPITETGSGGAVIETLPARESIATAAPASLWQDRGDVRQSSGWHAFYTVARTSIYSNLATLYARYDQLVTDFPDYVSRTTLGQDALGNPVHQYVFRPALRRVSDVPQAALRPPKIIILSGIHGSESMAILSTLIFAENLCRWWSRYPGYSDLRFGAEIVIIPAANPSGVNANSRGNHAGVDINRNYDWNWAPGTGTENLAFGNAAADQPEIQIMQSLPALHGEIAGLIDHHNHGEPQLWWMGSPSEAVRAMTIAEADDLTGWYHRQIRADVNPQTGIFWQSGSSTGGTGTAWFGRVAGWPVTLLETPASVSHPLLDGTALTQRRVAEYSLLRLALAFLDTERQRRKLAVA